MQVGKKAQINKLRIRQIVLVPSDLELVRTLDVKKLRPFMY